MPGQSIPFQLTGNSAADIPIPYWQPGAIGVTNPGSCWVHFPQSAGADAWVPPRQYGVMIRPPVATGSIRVDSTTTPSAIYPIDLSDLTPCQLTVWEDAWPLSPGQSLLPLIPSAGFSVSGVIDQAAILPIAQTIVDQAGAATLTLNAPAGIQNGDVLVAVVGELNALAITSPTGWTRQSSVGVNATGRVIVDTHTAIPGDPASWNWTGTNLSDGIIQCYRGVESVNPVETSATQTYAAGSPAVMTSPSLTTLTPNDWLLCIFALIQGAGGTATFTTPSGLSLRGSATGTNRRLSLFDSNGPLPPGIHGGYSSSGAAAPPASVTVLALIPSRAPINLTEINGRLFDAATKGVQPSIALPTQDLKDSGRAQVMLSWEEMAGTAAAESALTNFTLGSLNAAALGAANNYAVSAGKTLRIQTVTIYLKSTAAAAVLGRYRIRQAAAVANNSPVILDAVMALDSATFAAGQGDELSIPIPDNLEVAGGQQITFTWFTSVNTSTVGMAITGYEY